MSKFKLIVNLIWSNLDYYVEVTTMFSYEGRDSDVIY